MFKLLRRIICFLVIGILAFFIIAILEGGEPFRWLGQKSEETGKMIHQKSDEIADKADKVQKTKKALEKETEKIEKVKRRITDK